MNSSPFLTLLLLLVFQAGHWSALSKGFPSLGKWFCTLHSSYQLYQFWCFALLGIKYDLKYCSLLVHCKQCILELSSSCIMLPSMLFYLSLWQTFKVLANKSGMQQLVLKSTNPGDFVGSIIYPIFILMPTKFPNSGCFLSQPVHPKCKSVLEAIG